MNKNCLPGMEGTEEGVQRALVSVKVIIEEGACAERLGREHIARPWTSLKLVSQSSPQLLQGV
jgi:hypothetical protein